MAISSSDDRIDDGLVREARAGDERALDQLIRRHEGTVLRVLRLLGTPVEQREDVAQEVFLRVFRHLGGYRTGRSFSGWLYRICVNAAHDQRRRTQRRDRDEVDWARAPDQTVDTQPGPDAIAAQKSRIKLLEDALGSLTERERAVFVLSQLEELSNREVAQSLGITTITVRRHLGRARRRLQSLLDPGGSERKTESD